MNKSLLSVRSIGLAALIAGSTLTFVACSEDENQSPSRPPPVGSGGSDSDASAGGKSGGSGGKSGGSGGATGSGAVTGSGGESTGSGGAEPGDGGGGTPGTGGQGTITDGGGCQEDPSTDCYECPINGQNVTFLNRCPVSPGVPATVAFPNATRIQRSDWQPGQPLP